MKKKENDIKSIMIDDVKLYYDVCFNVSECSTTEWTEFWYNKPFIKKVKLFWLFGPLVTEITTEPDFILKFDIEKYDISEIKEEILKHYEKII